MDEKSDVKVDPKTETAAKAKVSKPGKRKGKGASQRSTDAMRERKGRPILDAYRAELRRKLLGDETGELEIALNNMSLTVQPRATPVTVATRGVGIICSVEYSRINIDDVKKDGTLLYCIIVTLPFSIKYKTYYNKFSTILKYCVLTYHLALLEIVENFEDDDLVTSGWLNCFIKYLNAGNYGISWDDELSREEEAQSYKRKSSDNLSGGSADASSSNSGISKPKKTCF
ncbi:unnamed protein product [Brassicogethes aeneus]|uniref:Uncharacterized protein n=1 Tax=Brassicogethes aeneus TaxID=1431903 RepID=A0A9P0AXW1_BRAAE|nr:unnamed protein product [Brassicogethes aeneus]